MIDNLFRVVHNFSVVIYSRLSKEDENKTDIEKSQSIINQSNICHKYIEEEIIRYPNCKYEIISELYDDGISGTTFDRDSFQQLLKLITEKKVNMVITKDLSRLGRDHILTDYYVEKWFPSHNVRYVSIMENIDTYADTLSNDIAPIINWSNEHFAKLTSKKIKKQFELLRKEGKWCGGEPPLGYKIDKNKKYHLVIVKKEATIVKKIFYLAKQHKSPSAIANILTEEKIPIPTILKGNKRRLKKELIDLWSSETIKKILTNEIYLGHMIQGKTTKLNHKSKKNIVLPKERWIKILNTHKPIVDEETFNIVKTILKTNKHNNSKTHYYLLKGFLKCHECHHTIGIQCYKERIYSYTVCNYYRKYGSRKKVCTSHRFRYDLLENIIINNVKEQLKKVDFDFIITKLNKMYKSRNNDYNLDKEIIKIKELIKKYESQLDIIYNDKLEGIIDEKQYLRQINNKKNKIRRLNDKLDEFHNFKNSKNDDKIDKIKEIVNKFCEFKIINRNILVRLISDIKVSDDRLIYVYYKFGNTTTK